MPSSRITYKIDTENNIVLGHAEGVISFQDFELHTQVVVTDPDFQAGTQGLYDFSKVTKVVGDPTFFERTSDILNNSSHIKEHTKVALVISNNSRLEGIFSGWKVMMSFTLVSYETFPTLEDARKWLASE